MSQEHRDWQVEKQRLQTVTSLIKKKKEDLQEVSADLKKDVIELRRTFWDDVTVNIDEPDDVLETQASMKQRAELLSERERSHGLLHQQAKTLRRLEEAPYFGRIDFIEDGEKEAEPIYIGIASLMDENDEDFLVYDWRAPISSMYYDFAPGRAQYPTIEGDVEGEITLKRQYIVKGGELEGMFDTGLTIGDELLQALLGQQSTPQMKSIVASIQREQNQVIRNERSKILIVRGVAGSGKTSAALQRVAYLLYKHREKLNAGNMLLFSPNPLFTRYVSNVLPELGEDNLQQTTLFHHFQKRLPKGWQLESPYAQIEYFLSEQVEPIRSQGLAVKTSPELSDQLHAYLASLSDSGLMFKDLYFRGDVWVTKMQMEQYFYQLDERMSIPNRLELVVEWLLQMLQITEKEERPNTWVDEEMDLLDEETYKRVFEKVNENEDELGNDQMMEETLLRKLVVRRKIQPLRKQIQAFDLVDMEKMYIQFYRWANNKVIAEEIGYFFQDKKLHWEDAAPFFYLEDQLKGRPAYADIRHIFIDEAQDYASIQILYLQNLFPTSRMTLLGDANQAVHAHTNAGHSPLIEDPSAQKQETITLLRSYRSTQPIVEFTKRLIPNGEQIESFERPGPKPEIMHTGDEHEKDLCSLVQELTKRDSGTVAVITKTFAGSEQIWEWLDREGMSAQLIHEQTSEFKEDLLVLPVYLAKGIEFDVVVVSDASAAEYHLERDRYLLYTACTRAMHELYLCANGELPPLITEGVRQSYVQG
ncbi:RNA polymerase recycling motor HelD [Natribacillus halophilus]|uniref:DNA helicase-2 / ATP-dependent DNA helicase PcrA n=1 Tax=Natribacillus halophilus TaxID=549003 RepID=A0A1G8S2S6_9BACI|nr:RNA polymerase recycling motor HelD [Natribacillus halophilus]SDJ23503.1 DNA helicase-2 / ATP-dependent DNA helicase PcrA [Natribacillus halophilus]